ncbi:SusF/SusE family outer membrane protein [Viscerimonas tarda]
MKTIYKILAICIVASGFAACDDDLMNTDKGNQPLVLSATETELALDITAPESNALTFNWTPGSNFNTNTAISYTLELAKKGTDFDASWEQTFDKGVTSASLKTEKLNDVLINHFGIAPNEEAELEARVTAIVRAEGIAPQVSGTVAFKVSGYKPVSKTLYLIGDASPNGWSADNATKMNSVTGTAGGFTWQGKLTAGSLKFITNLGDFTPSYNKGSDDTKLYFRESDDDPYDEKFVIATAGVYRITLNIITLAIRVEALDAPEYSELWFVGNPTGWSFKPMTVDASDQFVFHYNADLSAGGEIKIATQENWDAVFFRPEIDATPEGSGLNVAKWAGDPDYKWNISGGIYKIALNTRDMKIDIVPFTPYAMIYLVGSATPKEWDINNATPMTAGGDPYKFTWTGQLNTGELKFTCDKQSDWNGAWFLASQPGMAPTGSEEQMIFHYPGAGADNKWNITEAGTYSIELDQLQETVVIKKQ